MFDVHFVANTPASQSRNPNLSRWYAASERRAELPSIRNLDSSMALESDSTYATIQSGPTVVAEDVEPKGTSTVEVMILWGTSIIYVEHLRAGRCFAVGEDARGDTRCDFFIPAEKLGTTHLPLINSNATQYSVLIPENATGSVVLTGRDAIPLDELRRNTRCSSLGCQLTLSRGTKLRLEFADIAILVAAVDADKPWSKGIAAGLSRATAFPFCATIGLIGGLMATMAVSMPTLADSEDPNIESYQANLMQQYLVAAAEREQEANQVEATAQGNASEDKGGTGTRAASEEGTLGHTASRDRKHKLAVAGEKTPVESHVAREAALAEARTIGMIGLLNSGILGESKALAAPWGRDQALGKDASSFNGNMWGDELGDTAGAGGFGLSGVGIGGGGRGDGIGIIDIGGLGHGLALGDNDGMGRGHGRIGGAHRTRTVSLRTTGNTIVSGRLPPAVIQRIVRQNYGRFRLCYEQGLVRNPNLEGRVNVRFVINREGAVASVQNGGSDLPDSAVTNCVIGAYYGLSFPPPEGGIVTVSYPILFQPG